MIKVEWIRQVRRARTWACMAALAAVPIIVTVATYLDPPRRGRRGGLELNLFTILTSSGINVAVVGLEVMADFFLVVVVAAFAGESISGEATWGTLRYLLVRPVGRARLVLAKIGVAYALAVIAVLVILLTSLIAGTIAFGWHEPTVIKDLVIGGRAIPFPGSIPIGEGLGRVALATGYVALMMLPVVAIGVFLSTLTDSTAAAVVSTIVVVVATSVLKAVPSLSSIRPVLLTQYWDQWHNLFEGGSATDMWKGVISAFAWFAIFTAAAIIRFGRKDITS